MLACLLLVACGPLTALAGMSSGNNPGAATGLPTSPLVLALMGLVMLGTGFLALLPLVPVVRRGLAYVLPINPASIVHGVALSLTLLVIGVSVAQLPVAMSLADPNSPQQASLETFNSLPLLWLQGFMFVLYGFFGVGWTIRRGWRDTLARLGLGRLTPAYLSIALAAWLGLLLLDFLVSLVWRTVLPTGYEQFGRLSEALFGSFISIPGALTIGLSAGIGEEILFRGALQPRLGLPLTSLLFMIVHAQYGFTPALVQGLSEAFDRIAAHPACKVVVLSGYDRYFSTGGTRETLQDIQSGKVRFTDAPVFVTALRCPVPVIAAMQGHAVGGGLSLGLFADFALFSAESQGSTRASIADQSPHTSDFPASATIAGRKQRDRIVMTS